MSPMVFVCTTPRERLEDLRALGDHLRETGYDVVLGEEWCSPRGQALLRERCAGEERVALVCKRGLGKEVFRGALPGEAGFLSYEGTEDPKDLAVRIHEEMTLMPTGRVLLPPPRREVLVVGGGVAGVYAALDTAEQGYPVYLVDKDPSIGGIMAALDKTFPTMDCSI
ncbi:FAD-dependent oxidoreductase [Candidatus Solincola tengchongensis]|uniref:FAD-dependent oxidoreductase n=1 Tax=Candidatus Solincola tengchongensis TaxID=2900693 RepID=UPI00257AC68C|nr:FAD-dependent oxidoreductase [Candidatus Solincola tengchongensis]